jgi:hypothetical protein
MKKMTKTLSLAKETVRSLADKELASAGGGARNENGTNRCSKVPGTVCISCAGQSQCVYTDPCGG